MLYLGPCDAGPDVDEGRIWSGVVRYSKAPIDAAFYSCLGSTEDTMRLSCKQHAEELAGA